MAAMGRVMTFRLRLRRFLRLALAWGVLFALCLACTVEEGERSSTGACPEGETCSDATPTGLTFYGPPPSDDATAFLPRLAMGGSQNISFAVADGGEIPDAAVDTDAPWFLEVEPADEERDAYAIWTGERDVRLTGLAEGDAYLRVTHPDTGELYDRVRITVERVYAADAVDSLGETPALVPGVRATLVFRLLGESQQRLIDEAMTIESETPFERASWDCIDFDVPDADEVTFTLDAGHRRWAVTVPVQR